MGLYTKQKTYIRIFLTLSLIFSFVIIPYTFFLTSQFSKYADTEINKLTNDKLNQTLENAQFLLNKIKIYGLSIYNDHQIKNWLFSESKDPLVAMKAVDSMKNLLSNEPFIYKTYMININMQSVIDSQTGLHTFEQFEDSDMIHKIKNDRPQYLRYFNHTINNQSYLSLVIPSTLTNNDYNGYLVILLNNQLFQKYLLQSNKEIDVFILDQQGKAAIGSTVFQSMYPTLTSLKKDDTGQFNVEINNREWSVNYVEMQPELWTIYYMTDLSQLRDKVMIFRNKIIFSSLLLLSVLLLLVFWNSRRSYKPFTQLADLVKGKVTKDIPKTSPDFSKYAEYTILKQGIEILFDNMDKMAFSLRNHQELINSEYLRQWILIGRMNNSIRNNIQAESDLLSCNNLYLIVFRIDNYYLFTQKYNNFESRKLIKYAMGNIIKEVLQNCNWLAESVDLGGDHIVVLTGINEDNDRELAKLLLDISSQIEKWLSIQVVIGWSESFGENSEIRFLYEDTYESTELKFMQSSKKIFDSKDYRAYKSLVKQLEDPTLLESLIQCVRLGDMAKTKSLLDQIMGQMQNLPYAECKFQLTLTIHTLLKSFKQFSSIKSEGIHDIFERFSTLNDVRNWLQDVLEEIILNMRQRKSSSRKDELVLEIVEYLKNRIHDPSLTVEELSDHLSLSVSYIRQVFKEVYDMTLADYILVERIKNVKHLLESSKWSVTDIAESSGFQTKSYFYTEFKKATGMTPNQYRQDRKIV